MKIEDKEKKEIKKKQRKENKEEITKKKREEEKEQIRKKETLKTERRHILVDRNIRQREEQSNKETTKKQR